MVGRDQAAAFAATLEVVLFVYRCGSQPLSKNARMTIQRGQIGAEVQHVAVLV